MTKQTLVQNLKIQKVSREHKGDNPETEEPKWLYHVQTFDGLDLTTWYESAAKYAKEYEGKVAAITYNIITKPNPNGGNYTDYQLAKVSAPILELDTPESVVSDPPTPAEPKAVESPVIEVQANSTDRIKLYSAAHMAARLLATSSKENLKETWVTDLADLAQQIVLELDKRLDEDKASLPEPEATADDLIPDAVRGAVTWGPEAASEDEKELAELEVPEDIKADYSPELDPGYDEAF